MALAAFVVTAAQADVIRPNGATATSEFSGSYLVTNAINGTGLPANFSLSDAHATYAPGNHWTTQANRTIGESATFTFNQPVSVGGFHMWAHRSNGVASNPYYAVTRFDLVLRDGAGATLAQHLGLVGVPNVPTAQSYAFNIVDNVRSIQFIVRATNNNNVSPYTGLAEVAFDTCIAATTSSPSNQIVCPGGTAMLVADVGGSGPLVLRWERVDGSGNAVTLSDGPLPGSSAVISGATTNTLTVAGVDVAATSFTYRLVVGNRCSQTTSVPTVLSYCPVDANCDGFNDFFDYDQFVSAFESGGASADFNGDGFLDFFDYDDFVAAYEQGC